jgi:hypothetical protein
MKGYRFVKILRDITAKKVAEDRKKKYAKRARRTKCPQGKCTLDFVS